VTNGTSNTLTVIDGSTNGTSTVNVGSGPGAVDVNSTTNKAYVGNYGDGTVSVVNGTVVAATITVGSFPLAVAVNSTTNQIYVGNSGDGTITVIDGATNVAIATVSVGSDPSAISWNTTTNVAYVINKGDDTVSVIAGASPTPTPTPTPAPTPTPNPIEGGSGPSTRLINISTRAMVGTGGSILIPGFVISGSGSETLLIRADGPALTGFGVAGALAQPSLSVFDSGGHVLASNTGWGTSSDPSLIASTAATVGAFSFISGSLDCALIASLPAGAYTVQVSGVGGTTGVALAEVYEVSSTGTRLINISTRAQVGTGANIIIPGFVISGTGSEQLLVRADGPGLAQFGVGGLLAKPSLSVFDNSGTSIATNTGWTTASDPTLVSTAASEVGAFAFSPGSADSALIVDLTAGAYTMQLSGVNNTTGVALAEIYEAP
jgi:YVTN family beta-propeller protein